MELKRDRKIIKSRLSVATRQLQSTNKLTEDMHSLLHNEMFSDVTLHCGCEVFRAHKNILSARSPVFAAMFLNPMRESQTDHVDIQGMEPATLREMLSYMYCCKTQPLTASVACELLSAADMYQLPGLKKVCIAFLKYIICEENVLRIIRVGDLYDDSLRIEAAKFICDKYESIEKKMEWKFLQTDKPHLVIEVMALKIKTLKFGDGSSQSIRGMKFITAMKRQLGE